MLKYLAAPLLVVCLFMACKTSDSPQNQTATPVQNQISDTPVSDKNTTTLDRETQHKFEALVKQGDTNYAEGNYREALNFYKKAQSLAPDQLGNDKLIACLKALQEPSTRRK